MTSEQPPERSGRHGLPGDGGASLPGPGAPERDAGRLDRQDRHRDRVELSLDGRQVFFLFFGSAVLSCLLFVSGVLVGRRIEQRAAVPPPAEDPLSSLDELEGEAEGSLTFPDELVQKRRATREAREAAARGSGARATPRDEHGPAPAGRAASATTASSAPAPLPPMITPPRREAGGAAQGAREAGHEAAPAPKPSALPAAPAPSGRFTLQLSSFADRADAEAFAERLRGGGLVARVVESKVDGKGTFFRVRSGDFSTRQAAVEAKVAYDRTHSDPAMVAPE